MIEQDTIKLLRECDLGINMGVQSIDNCLASVTSDRMKETLEESKREHEVIRREILDSLNRFGDKGKDAGPLVEGMSYIKTKVSLAMDDSDRHIANLMIDGCNMGIKSLSKYLNEYAAASEYSKDLTNRIIAIEEKLAHKLRDYL